MVGVVAATVARGGTELGRHFCRDELRGFQQVAVLDPGDVLHEHDKIDVGLFEQHIAIFAVACIEVVASVSRYLVRMLPVKWSWGHRLDLVPLAPPAFLPQHRCFEAVRVLNSGSG